MSASESKKPDENNNNVALSSSSSSSTKNSFIIKAKPMDESSQEKGGAGTSGGSGAGEAPRVATNIVYQNSRVSRDDRLNAFYNNNQSGCTIWFTGLSCAGKTTLSFALEEYLVKKRNLAVYCLDGDNIRYGLNSNLGFSDEDRRENIRRIGEVSKLFADSGFICLTSFISPFASDRNRVRSIHEKGNLNFVEVYVKASLEVCEQRDVKGLYKKARSGIIKDFTGIHSVYEEPYSPEIEIDTSKNKIEDCVSQIISYLELNGIIRRHETEESYQSRELFVKPSEAESAKEKAKSFHKLNISMIELQWVQVLSEGWASPLRGFMNEDEYLQALHFNSIRKNGRVYSQSVPIVLSCTDADKEQLKDQTSVCLVYQGKEIGYMTNISIFPHRKEERCARQFGLVHRQHPYQKFIFEECGDWLIGGDVHVFEKITWNDGLDQYRLTPFEIIKKCQEMKADAVFAFQLRNPIHNGHALLMKDTRKHLLGKGFKNPVLLLHPLGGWTKDDDAPLNVRIEQHKAVLDDGNYLDSESTLMAIFPSPMMYAGPTEVQWHAKTRMNAGVQFYIVGRDPAGMPHPDTKQDLYDPTHGARVLQMAPALESLEIVPFKVAAYNKALKKMDYFNPKEVENFEFISGTKMRKLAREGAQPPDGFMVSKAWDILANYYKNLNQQ